MAKALSIVKHSVADYAAWRTVYEEVQPLRDKYGVSAADVLQDPADPNKVVIIHRFPSLQAAQEFLGDPGLKEAMMKGGVTAPPTVILAVAG